MKFLNNLIKTAIVYHLNKILLVFFVIFGIYATSLLFRKSEGFVSEEEKNKI